MWTQAGFRPRRQVVSELVVRNVTGASVEEVEVLACLEGVLYLARGASAVPWYPGLDSARLITAGELMFFCLCIDSRPSNNEGVVKNYGKIDLLDI